MFDSIKRWRRRHSEVEKNIQDELAYHLEALANEQADRGVNREEAQFAARRKLGNVTRAQENTRAVWIVPAIEGFLQDLRYAVRMLSKSPAFTLTAVLSLALGIGANTAIFSLINAFLLRMLPVPNPQQLLEVVTVSKQDARQLDSFPYPAIKMLEQRADSFSGICGFSAATFNAAPPGALQSTPGAWVTGRFYETLGVKAAIGRLLTPQDDSPGSDPVAVIEYGFWETRYHRNPEAIGKQLLIDGTPVTIVGVSAQGFEGATVGSIADITLPVASLPALFPERARNLAASSWWLRVLGRPKPDASEAAAKAQLSALWPGITKELVISIRSAATRKAILASSVDLVPGGTGWTYLRNKFTRPLMALMALVAIVLVLACVNLANLLLTRATARSKEFGVRVAIGAGRWRIARQLLTESVLLAFIGSALGIALAFAGDRLLIDLSSGKGSPLVLDVRPDLRVLAFTLAVAMATGVLFGLAPAIYASASAPGSALKETQTQSGKGSRLSSVLITLQIAFSLLLLVAGGLFVRTLENLENLDMGFHHEGVLLATLDPRHAGFKDVRLISLYEELLEAIGRIPGVESVSLSDNTPLSGGIWSDPILINGAVPQHASRETAHFNSVTPGFFATLRTPLLLGRDFDTRDSAPPRPVAIVNDQFVRTFLSGRNPLGERISSLDNPQWHDMQIVGVVKNTISFDLREPPPPFVYVPYLSDAKGARGATFEVRAEGSLAHITDEIQTKIHMRLPDTAFTITPFTKQVRDSLVQERLMAMLASFFGLAALALAAIGLYGLVAYAVTRRTSEIGIRLALGATRGNVLTLVLRGALILTAGGIAIGLPLAFAGSSFISKMLFGVRPADPITASVASALLISVAAMAAYIPARRAAKVDPLTALRYE